MNAPNAQLVGTTSADAHSIQPDDAWRSLATKEAERLDRLAADVELVDRLMWAGYAGREWERFRTELARYGVVVITSWIRSGRIFARCAERGVRGLRRRPGLAEDALELAGETVARALSYFREKVLVPRIWDPTRGASIGTFFVGACVLHLPNVYRGWLRDGSQEQPCATETDRAVLIEDEGYYARPDRRLDLVGALDSAVADPVLREVFVLEASGYTKDEIAKKLATTCKAVESKLYRFRELRDGKRGVRQADRAFVVGSGRRPTSSRTEPGR